MKVLHLQERVLLILNIEYSGCVQITPFGSNGRKAVLTTQMTSLKISVAGQNLSVHEVNLPTSIVCLKC